MTNGLSDTQTKLLTWLVYALMFFLTTITIAHTVQFMAMPEKYVLLERYKSDELKHESSLKRIEDKLDHLIMDRNNLTNNQN